MKYSIPHFVKCHFGSIFYWDCCFAIPTNTSLTGLSVLSKQEYRYPLPRETNPVPNQCCSKPITKKTSFGSHPQQPFIRTTTPALIVNHKPCHPLPIHAHTPSHEPSCLPDAKHPQHPITDASPSPDLITPHHQPSHDSLHS